MGLLVVCFVVTLKGGLSLGGQRGAVGPVPVPSEGL